MEEEVEEVVELVRVRRSAGLDETGGERDGGGGVV